jgi:hypothetical protein
MYFTKFEVLELIDDAIKSIPTPTDKDHQAHWWNEGFGRRIKAEMENSMLDLKQRVEYLVEVP